MIKKLDKKLVAFFTNIAGALLAGILIFVVLAVLDRSFFKIGFFWTEEIARTFNVWFSMFAPTIMITAGTQFALDYFADKLFKGKARDILFLVTALLIVVVLCIITVSGVQYVIAMHKQTMPTLGVSIAVMYSALPVGFFCMIVMYIIAIIERIMRMMGKLPPEEDKTEAEQLIELAEELEKQEGNVLEEGGVD